MKIEALAKVNFTLEVLGRRPDGYHELRSVVLPVTLSDILEIEESSGIESDTGYGEGDLAVKAARALAEFARVKAGAKIHIDKRIPVGGGLGGGSADAAATLVALNEIWGLGLSREELSRLGASVGSDVPSLVMGGAVLMEGRGERVKPISSPEINLVIANPGVNSSTREVYSRCVPVVRRQSSSQLMVDALADNDLPAVSDCLVNDLQESAISLYPAISRLTEEIRSMGAQGVLMSGSGSSVFGVFEAREDAIKAAEALREKNFRAWHCRTLASQCSSIA